MSRLTVTEKEHWKSRIERRIDQTIESLASQEPSLLPSIREEAEDAANKSLGIDGCKSTIAQLERETQTLEAQKNEVERAMHTQVFGKEAWQGTSYSRYSIEKAVKTRQLVHENELLAQSKLGEQILALRREREALLDTVWLATSSIQIRELWGRVEELLGGQPTNLQQAALKISSDSTN